MKIKHNKQILKKLLFEYNKTALLVIKYWGKDMVKFFLAFDWNKAIFTVIVNGWVEKHE